MIATQGPDERDPWDGFGQQRVAQRSATGGHSPTEGKAVRHSRSEPIARHPRQRRPDGTLGGPPRQLSERFTALLHLLLDDGSMPAQPIAPLRQLIDTTESGDLRIELPDLFGIWATLLSQRLRTERTGLLGGSDGGSARSTGARALPEVGCRRPAHRGRQGPGHTRAQSTTSIRPCCSSAVAAWRIASKGSPDRSATARRSRSPSERLSTQSIAASGCVPSGAL